MHIGTAYGKMTGSKDEVKHIEEEIESHATRQTKDNLSQEWFGLKPVFAVASGGVHPGIVVGQLQHASRGELKYSQHRDMLAKVRDIVTTTALTDGWGHSLPTDV